MITKEEQDLINSIESDLKVKRMYSMIRIAVAIGLVVCIAFFCWVNYSYASDIKKYQKEYGPLWSCYICGYENLRSCGCINNYNNIIIDEEFKDNIGSRNILKCVNSNPMDLKLELYE